MVVPAGAQATKKRNGMKGEAKKKQKKNEERNRQQQQRSAQSSYSVFCWVFDVAKNRRSEDKENVSLHYACKRTDRLDD